MEVIAVLLIMIIFAEKQTDTKIELKIVSYTKNLTSQSKNQNFNFEAGSNNKN